MNAFVALATLIRQFTSNVVVGWIHHAYPGCIAFQFKFRNIQEHSGSVVLQVHIQLIK